MKFWHDIVNKATLGSSKMPLTTADLPAAITEAYALTDAGDAEEDFLRLSTLAYQYRQAGTQPLSLATIAASEAAAETNPYCDPRASLALKTILTEEHQPFLELWLTQCAAKTLCVHPELIPDLFEAVLRKPELHPLAIAVAGKRGEWLCSLNPRWILKAPPTDDVSVWETGKPEERRGLLQRLRETEPAAAITLLQNTWTTEGANDKVAFLEVLKTGASVQDLPWLQSLTEKGVKVNTALHEVLKRIPGSNLSESYREVVKSAIQIKTGKALLGMISKKTIEVNEAAVVPETIFKTGIEKVSSTKGVSDLQNVLAQLIATIEPAFWNTHLQEDIPGAIALFKKERSTAFYLPAVAFAAAQFHDHAWITGLLDHAADDLPAATLVELIGALHGKDKDAYALKLIKGYEPQFINPMLDHDREWSPELTKAILKFTAQDVYAYNKAFYRQAAPFIPASLFGKLDQFIPADDMKKSYWRTQSDELSRLLMLKQQTLQYFNA
jgi:hypothetical protein